MVNDRSIDQVRRLERLYERYLRKIERAVANEDFGVADTRVLHELGFAEGGVSGAWLAAQLDLDAAQVCRVLKKLEAYGLVLVRDSRGDRRMKDWELTRHGRDFADSIERQYRERACRALMALRPGEMRELVAAAAVVERLLRQMAAGAR